VRSPSALRPRVIHILALAGTCSILTLALGAATGPSTAAASIPAGATGPAVTAGASAGLQRAAAAGITVGGSGSEAAVDPVTSTAFIGAGVPVDNIDVIDMAADSVTATIAVGAGPFAVAVDSATGLVYAASRAGDSVSVISPATDTVTATITGLTGEPLAIAADPTADKIYVALYERSTPAEIAVIDGATSTLATTITLPAGTPGGAGANSIAVDPDTGTVYLSFCQKGCGADIIDPATGTVIGQLAGQLASPPDLAVNPSTGTVYVAGGLGVTAYDAATGARIRTTDLGAAVTGIAVNPTAGTLYVPAGSNVYLLDAASLATTGILPGPTVTTIAADPATSTLALNSFGSLSLVTLHAPAITSNGQATLTAGHPATLSFTATGTPPPAFTSTGRLPAGLTLTTSGVITGTPGRRTGGTYPLTVTAANGVAPAATQQFTLTIRQAPVFTSPARAWFKVGVRHTFTIRASGYPAAVALTEHGKLPVGLRLTIHPGGTAALTGTPTRSDRGKTFRIRITASNHVGQPVTQTLTIHIAR
jgi:YVTN family beta-propeller protein